ncbi:MAG TPA: helix-turn-helix domain-containing protein [Candidatus Pelethocola excrementipullorum]|nr:helix-turn-helix domain-containing protein [Candidatus Pelethocola excrementipullorum]
MYTICIAEDEYYVQKSIEARINALHQDLVIRGCAYSGLEAEEIYYEYKPDIYFVDINMPQCSGLEFIEKIRSEDQDSKTVFIIVSGYSDYQNMRKAISVNVFDYLKKPIVPSEFVTIIENAIKEVDRLKRVSRPARREEIFFDDYLESVNNKKMSGTLVLLLQYSENSKMLEEFSQNLKELGKYMHFIFKNTEYVHVFYFQDRKIKGRFIEKSVLRAGVRILGGSVFYREMGENNMEEELRIMERMLNLRFFRKVSCKAVEEEGQPQPDMLKDMPFILLRKDQKSAEKLIRQRMLQLRENEDTELLDAFFHQFVFMAVKKYDEEEIMVPENLKRDLLLFSMVRFRDIQEVEEYLLMNIGQLFESLYQKEPTELIDKICEYIYTHYDEPLNLNALAGIFYLSPSYLSHYFKKHKSQSVVRFLEDFRLEKATEYLEKTDLPIADIAGKVGYGDGNYFAKVFRKKYNKSPSDYRKDMSK